MNPGESSQRPKTNNQRPTTKADDCFSELQSLRPCQKFQQRRHLLRGARDVEQKPRTTHLRIRERHAHHEILALQIADQWMVLRVPARCTPQTVSFERPSPLRLLPIIRLPRN